MNIRIAGRLQTLFSRLYCQGVHQGGKTRVLVMQHGFRLTEGRGGDQELLGQYPLYMGRFSMRGFPYFDLFSERDDVD